MAPHTREHECLSSSAQGHESPFESAASVTNSFALSPGSCGRSCQADCFVVPCTVDQCPFAEYCMYTLMPQRSEGGRVVLCDVAGIPQRPECGRVVVYNIASNVQSQQAVGTEMSSFCLICRAERPARGRVGCLN